MRSGSRASSLSFGGTPAVHIPAQFAHRTAARFSWCSCTTRVRSPCVPWRSALPARAWRRGAVTWRNGTNRPWAARFAAVRVTPANEWRNRRLAPEVWLLGEQDLGLTSRINWYFFVHLPATASLKQLVRLAHQRWAIEQQYQELKTELGLDHFEGRSYPGWHRHVVLTAVAYAFSCNANGSSLCTPMPRLTLPAVRAIVTETFTALLFAQKLIVLETHPRTTEHSALGSNKVVTSRMLKN